jgi:hypothetical protein
VVSFVVALVRALLFGWVRSLVELGRMIWGLVKARCRKEHDFKLPIHCFPVDHPAFMRPDPLLYSQRALIAQGLAVTWDNPDITLFKGGVPVSSSELEMSTTYEVRIRVWNNSFEAPVIQMPLHLSYLDFGVGTESIPIGSTITDVGVKGSATQPAFASLPWTTPATPGHFCLQVLLDPADDLDFTNNLGQENTDVEQATSPAQFSFTLRNNTKRTRRYHFEMDAYVITALPDCGSPAGAHVFALDRHRRGGHPVPPGFAIAIQPETPTLAPGASVVVQVSATPSPGFTGRQPINVNCFHENGFAGGVTLTIAKGV